MSQLPPQNTMEPLPAGERQVTRGPGGRILTNTAVWSPDSQWIVYDTRSDPAGDRFDGETIAMVHVQTGQVRELYRAHDGAHCGVATFHPRKAEVVFILGPEHPTPDWSYNACHRQGVMVDCAERGRARNLDARDLVPPFTPGALRGGSHVHVWDARGDWVSFTCEDHVLAQLGNVPGDHDLNQRNIGVSAPLGPVSVPRYHPRNQDGNYFSVLVTRTVPHPQPGSDEISRAFEEAWIGPGDGRRRALAFQGQVTSAHGQFLNEVYIVELPEDLKQAGAGPLCGTPTRAPAPPLGTVQRRLTFTADRKYPGLQGPRHWLRSSPDGSRIAFLMKDDSGVVQLWTVSPQGGPPVQVTRNEHPIASAFTWSPDGRAITYVMDRSVCLTDAFSGRTWRLTSRVPEAEAPRPDACVWSPDGQKIAFIRSVAVAGRPTNQICVVGLLAGSESGRNEFWEESAPSPV